MKKNYKLELSSASLRNWNDGMLEKWNNGMAPFGQINAYGGDDGGHWFCCQFSTLTNHSIKCYYFSIPTFHYSIIPVWNMQNGCLGIPYYQQFVEFPRHQITIKKIKSSHGFHQGSFKLQTMTALIKSFCGGSRGAVFSKRAPLAAGGKKRGKT